MMVQRTVGPSFRPLYEQIKGLLTRSLVAGEWKPGEAIPSENDLATRFKVSQGTVRKAIDALASENLLVRRQGKGTFVATHSEERAQHRFLRVVTDDGHAVATRSQLIGFARGRAHAEVAADLKLALGDAVYCVTRTLQSEGKALVLDEIVLPAALFPGLDAAALASFAGSWYSLYESAFGVRAIRASEHLRAFAAGEFAAQTLHVPPGTPLLRVDRVAYTYHDKPIEWRRGWCITDGYYYVNELS
jgi:GntR family transcriptional regulator